jgi:predicted nucleic acid-binding Zn ribbon protein
MPDIEATLMNDVPLGKCPECGAWTRLDEVNGKLHYYELEHCDKRYALMPKFKEPSSVGTEKNDVLVKR